MGGVEARELRVGASVTVYARDVFVWSGSRVSRGSSKTTKAGRGVARWVRGRLCAYSMIAKLCASLGCVEASKGSSCLVLV